MRIESIILLNNTKFGGKQLEINDSRGFMNTKTEYFQLPTNFYGNRVQNIAKTDIKGIYLLVGKGNVVFDVMANKEEIVYLEAAELRYILKAKNIKHTNAMPKEALLQLLGINIEEPKEEPKEE